MLLFNMILYTPHYPGPGYGSYCRCVILEKLRERMLRHIKIAVNDITTFAFVTESATKTAEIICCCAIFEDICILSTSTAGNELQKAILQLYVSVLRYLAKVKRYYDENSASKFVLLEGNMYIH
jgi:hypothetical protein